MNLTEYLGHKIEVRIDRPLGSRHPTHGFVYPVNYGYIPGTLAVDGEPIDAYVLGVFEPLDTFAGTCIAVIRRLEDDDDKLVVVPHGRTYTVAQIEALTEFQERFFPARDVLT